MSEKTQTLTFSGYELNLSSRTLCRVGNGETVRLSHSETLLLQTLVAAPGKTISRETLLVQCWPGRIVTQSSLNVAVKNLRQAFEKLGGDSLITTDPGKGYLLRSDERSAAIESKPLEAIYEAGLNGDELIKSKKYLFFGLAFVLGALVTFYTLFMYIELVEITEVDGVDVYYDGFPIKPDVLPSQTSPNALMLVYPKGGSVNCYQVVSYSDSEFVEESLGECRDK